ncbi:MAG: hypothetical protein HY390_05325 [Deltaproteobacteria bacterium]|nr:hypothetical protein [Deltaproteobacteria bacterium]
MKKLFILLLMGFCGYALAQERISPPEGGTSTKDQSVQDAYYYDEYGYKRLIQDSEPVVKVRKEADEHRKRLDEMIEKATADLQKYLEKKQKRTEKLNEELTALAQRPPTLLPVETDSQESVVAETTPKATTVKAGMPKEASQKQDQEPKKNPTLSGPYDPSAMVKTMDTMKLALQNLTARSGCDDQKTIGEFRKHEISNRVFLIELPNGKEAALPESWILKADRAQVGEQVLLKSEQAHRNNLKGYYRLIEIIE